MAVGYFEVDTDYLRRMVEELKQDLQAFQKSKEEINLEMESAKAMWKGPSKEAFFAQYNVDIAEYSDFCNKLNEAINAIDVAVQEYETSDRKARSTVDSIRV